MPITAKRCDNDGKADGSFQSTSHIFIDAKPNQIIKIPNYSEVNQWSKSYAVANRSNLCQNQKLDEREDFKWVWDKARVLK